MGMFTVATDKNLCVLFRYGTSETYYIPCLSLILYFAFSFLHICGGERRGWDKLVYSLTSQRLLCNILSKGLLDRKVTPRTCD